MAGLLIDLQIAEIAEKTVKKIPHVLNDRDSGNCFFFLFHFEQDSVKFGETIVHGRKGPNCFSLQQVK